MNRIVVILLPPAAAVALAAASAPFVSLRRHEDAATAAAASAAPSRSVAAGLPARVTFNRHVRPILSEKCFRCHGPDRVARKADLRLDRAEFAFAPRKDGKPVIFKGDPSAGALPRRIRSADPEEVMPPPESHKTLRPEEIALLERWIAQGAEYQPHWAFIKPERPKVPEVGDGATASPPPVPSAAGGAESRGGRDSLKSRPEGRSYTVRNPIDAFVLARLQEAGLAPNPEADRRTLIRRVTLDLTGLPPTPEEVEAFVKDAAPDAYEQLVDRLLARPQYGEHRARYWLDNVRYADTHGYHFDNYRSIWPYRDWVIQAFNDNMRFDRFTVEQVAGDLLPDPAVEQRIATGYVRCAMSTNEGGTIAEENEAIYAKDRVVTTAQVWLGLTMGCASCHDHKFDPLTQRDFYRMAAFFRNTTQSAMDGNVLDTPPVVRIPQPQDAARVAKLPGEIEPVKKALDARLAAAEPEFQAWHRARGAQDAPDVAADGLLLRLVPDPADPKLLRDLASEGRTFAVTGEPVAEPSPHGPAVRLPEGATADLGALGDVEADRPFAYGAWVKLPDNANGAILARMDEAAGFRGWDLWTQGSRCGGHIIHKWNENALKVVAQKPPTPGEWNHVFVAYDGSRKAAGMKIYYNGNEQPVYVEADTLTGTIRTPTPLRLGRRSAGQGAANAAVTDVRFYDRRVRPEEVRLLARRSALAAALKAPPGKRKAEDLKTLRDYYFAFVDAEAMRLRQALDALQGEFQAINDRSLVTLVAEEKPSEPFAHILIRGQYDQKGDRVGAGVPEILPPLPAGAPVNRLGLAKWLVSPDHPLTARVNVNRFWAQVFGVGIVPTPGEFGMTGEPPTNSDLLDWLAVEFRESGWDVKKLFRLMVTSAAYRQSAAATPEKLAKDPDNRLLSRGPRFRMDGEMIRDLALAASGLLSAKMGGPSVKPYQPPGLWEVVAMEESNTKIYVPDKGESLYRRSLYTFWKRAAPPPAMETFNAPSREDCAVCRERTNTPLQALVTLNDVQFVEAARALASRVIQEAPRPAALDPARDKSGQGGDAVAARLDALAARVLARPLAAEEKAALERAVKDLVARYEKNPKAAEALLKVGESPADASVPAPELAAWTMAAGEFFNLDEALNK